MAGTIKTGVSLLENIESTGKNRTQKVKQDIAI